MARGMYDIAWKLGMYFRDEPYLELKYLIITIAVFAFFYYLAYRESVQVDFYMKGLITIYSLVWPVSLPSIIVFSFLVCLIRALIYIKRKLGLFIIVKYRR